MICPMCHGEGKTYMAMAAIALPEKEQAEYERSVREQGKFDCALCNGTGRYLRPTDIIE